MKEINVTYKNGLIEYSDDNNGYYDQEDKSLKVNATINADDGKKVRAYLKAANDNTTVTDEIKPVDGMYSFVIDGEYMAEGTLYVGFEIYDDTGYTERFQPLKVYIDAFVSLNKNSGGNVYVVTVDVGTVTTLEPDDVATVENVGTKKDMILNFGIPRGQRITSVTTQTLDPVADPTVKTEADEGDIKLNLGIPRVPKVEVSETVDILEPGDVPTITDINESSDITLKFSLPRNQEIRVDETVEVLEPGETPTITDVDEGEDIKLKFGIPRNQTIAIAPITTIGPNEDALVENIGNEKDIKLKFSIPRNQEIRVDETVEVLEPGETPTITDVDEGKDITLKFGIPRNQTIAIEPVTTLEPGKDAVVENVGDEKDIRLKFSIPRGVQGIQGIQGIQGEKGDKGDTPVKGTDYLTDAEKEELFEETRSVAEEVVNEKAGVIELTSSGEAIQLTDSADSKFRGLKLFGKTTQITTTGRNLLPYPYDATTHTKNGVAFTDNGDGSWTLNGTTSVTIQAYVSLKQIVLKKDVIYTASTGLTESYAWNELSFLLNHHDSTGTIIGQTTVLRDAKQIDLSGYDDYSYTKVHLVYGNSMTYDNVIIYPQLEIGDTATDFEPYSGGVASPNPEYPQDLNSVGDDGSVNMGVCGKNLLPYPYNVTTHTKDGVAFTDNGDGSWTLNGTTSVTTQAYVSLKQIVLKKDVIYTASTGLTGSYAWNELSFLLNHHDSTGTMIGQTNVARNAVQIDVSSYDDYSYTKVYFVYGNSMTYDNVTIYPQLEIGDTATEYEPYKENILTISTSNGLPGIPVTSDGNYTDADGQMWVCDEVDFEKGMYIQRVYEYKMKGTESIEISTSQDNITEGMVRYDGTVISPNTLVTACLCTHFPCLGQVVNKGYNAWVATYSYSPRLSVRFVTHHQTAAELKEWLAENYNNGEPVTFKYILETPIETPLTEEEIAMYKALQTYKPVTNIKNDENAYMEVDYAADTKTYIDNKIEDKFTALQNAIVSLGGNV